MRGRPPSTPWNSSASALNWSIHPWSSFERGGGLATGQQQGVGQRPVRNRLSFPRRDDVMDRSAAGQAQGTDGRFIARRNSFEPEPDHFSGAADLVVMPGARPSVPQRDEHLAQFRDQRSDLRVLAIPLVAVPLDPRGSVAGHERQDVRALRPREQPPEVGTGVVAREVLLVEISWQRHRDDQAHADIECHPRHQPVASSASGDRTSSGVCG